MLSYEVHSVQDTPQDHLCTRVIDCNILEELGWHNAGESMDEGSSLWIRIYLQRSGLVSDVDDDPAVLQRGALGHAGATPLGIVLQPPPATVGCARGLAATPAHLHIRLFAVIQPTSHGQAWFTYACMPRLNSGNKGRLK